VGQIPKDADPILGDRLAEGDEIIFLASSGLHANGASIARRVAHDLPDGFHTRLPSGSLLGDAILTPSLIYAPLIADLLSLGISPTYASHITGHGFRKLMRASRDFVYRIRTLPKVPEVLTFLAERSRMDARESYATFNMGAGFAIFCRPEDSERVVERAKAGGFVPLRGGELDRGPRSVRLEPLDITFAGDDLSLR
jgi:phosphoribosylformylglycinamidine cyclo-ligase